MDFFRIGAAFLLVFGLLYALRKYAVGGHSIAGMGWLTLGTRRLPGLSSRSVSREVSSLRVAKRVPLTTTHQLHSVVVGEKTLLLCTHPHGCEVIDIEARRTDAL